MTAPTPADEFDPSSAFAQILQTFEALGAGQPLAVYRVHMASEGRPQIQYRNEADIRRGLANLAYAYGWDVRQEVVIPGWGRIDLVLKDRSPGSILIELKADLSTARDVRRGYQQADGYGRWWRTNKNEPATAILAAAAVTNDLVAPVASAYPEVGFRLVGEVMDGLAHWGDVESRRSEAARRLEWQQQLGAVHEYATRRLRGES